MLDERIRELRYKGLSEEDAIREAHVNRLTQGGGKGRLFAVVTKDMSGLGIAKKLQEDGEQVVLVTENEDEDADGKKLYEQVGKGVINKRMPLDRAKTELKSPTTYWVFTENNFPKVADALRKQGQKVFGTSAFSDKMEHDREFAIEQAKAYGLNSPETIECHSRVEGLSHLDENPDVAYVLKPDEGANADTFVPELEDDVAANEETYDYLEHMAKEPGGYILQERVRGTEVNLEVDMFEGEPFFAFATLEAKRKEEGDYGEMAGCAGDVVWAIPVDCELVKQTVGKMFPLYKQERYTGPADVNVILTDKGPVFLEACCRLGYNAHPNLFLGLAHGSLGDILADWMDGNVRDFGHHFGDGFSASVSLYLNDPKPGLPVNVGEMGAFYPFDGYLQGKKLLLAGYSPEVGIFVQPGETPEAAFKACYQKLCDEEAFSFPNRYLRLDLAETGYPNAIMDRYRALEQKGLTGRENRHRDHPARGAALQHGRGLLVGPGRDVAGSHQRDGRPGPRDARPDSRAGRVGAMPEARDSA